MKIIDSHFHIYKTEQAGLMAQGGKSLIGFNGILEEAVPILDRGKISKIIALAVIPIQPMRQAAMGKWPGDIAPQERNDLTKELEDRLLSRLTRYNDWLCQVAHEDGRMEPVIMADPTVDKNAMVSDIIDKLERYKIKALKIHPAVNGLPPTAEGYEPIFELAQDKNLVIISHGGVSGEDLEGKFCMPESFGKVLDNFPKLKLVVAHMAFPHMKSLLEMAPLYPNLYTDLSAIFSDQKLTDDEFCEMIKNFGIERVLFGSDFPWFDPDKNADRLLRLNLGENELEMLAWKNSTELFGLS